MDSRVAIVGQNGTGKSTLLNLITGALQPVEGTVSRHVNLKLAKYSQHSADQLPYDKSPLDHIQSLYHTKYPEKDLQAWRGQLGRFGLSGTHQVSPIYQLSDGLRNRYVYHTSLGKVTHRFTVWYSPSWLWNTRTSFFLVSPPVQNFAAYHQLMSIDRRAN